LTNKRKQTPRLCNKTFSRFLSDLKFNKIVLRSQSVVESKKNAFYIGQALRTKNHAIMEKKKFGRFSSRESLTGGTIFNGAEFNFLIINPNF